MLPSHSFNSLKRILPKIHHPAPLDKKGTQKLLDALTTSFRRHLDREHGWLDDEVDAAATAAAKRPLARRSSNGSSGASAAAHATTGTNPVSLPKPSQHRPPHLHPTERHLLAVLSNPLINYDQTLGNQDRRGEERDPMDIFDWAVARGQMTTRRAAGCLMAKRRELVQSSDLSTRDAMATSGAGLKVVQWLRASGLERDLSFLTDAQLTSFLLRFMVAEGLDDIAWGWIERLRKEGGGPTHVGTRQEIPTVSFLLSRLVRYKADGAQSLDDAYLAMSRGADLFEKGRPEFEQNLFWPWQILAWISTLKAWSLSTPSPRLYDGFVAIMDSCNSRFIRTERAHLDLIHPTHPTPAPAVELLEAKSTWNRALQGAATPGIAGGAAATAAVPPGEPGRRPSFALRIMSLGLDTVRHLTLIGEAEEAQRILDLLRANIGDKLGELSKFESSRINMAV